MKPRMLIIGAWLIAVLGIVGPACRDEITTPAPSVVIDPAQVEGQAPLAVTFTAHAAAGTPPFTWTWDFGDGAASAGDNVSHEFGVGTCVVKVSGRDATGREAVASATVICFPNEPPPPPPVDPRFWLALLPPQRDVSAPRDAVTQTAISNGTADALFKLVMFAIDVGDNLRHGWVAVDFGGGTAGGGITLYNRFKKIRFRNGMTEILSYYFVHGDGDSWSGAETCGARFWNLNAGSSDREYLLRHYGAITAIRMIDHPPYRCGDNESL